MKHPEAIVPPLVVLVVVCGLVALAGLKPYWPVSLPACGFRETTGLPCFACGGTRAFRALALGHPADALRFNPLAVLAAFAVPVWLFRAWIRARRGPRPPLPPAKRRRRIVWISSLAVLALVANWLYLVRYLP